MKSGLSPDLATQFLFQGVYDFIVQVLSLGHVQSPVHGAINDVKSQAFGAFGDAFAFVSVEDVNSLYKIAALLASQFGHVAPSHRFLHDNCQIKFY